MSELLYDFDDVELYAPCFYKGKKGYVVEKGRDISHTNGRQLLISLEDPAGLRGNTEYLIHEKTVNKYLEKQKKLWVDFEWKVQGE